jgi:lauroyl/myristoyl acyltransferase
VYLALRSGAALLPLVTFYQPGKEADYVTQIGQPLALDRSAALDEALEQGASLVAAELEAQLRAHPADWHFWDEFQPGRFVVEPA